MTFRQITANTLRVKMYKIMLILYEVLIYHTNITKFTLPWVDEVELS
jgi:hypothetical protein